MCEVTHSAWRVENGGACDWSEPGGGTVAAIGMTAAGYDEFYRLRSPLDWAYPAAFTLVALDVAGAPRQRLSYSTRAT